MSDYIPDDWPEAEGELPPSLEYLLGKFINAIQGATGILKNDFRNVMTWYEAMRQALITYIQAAYMAGQNSDYIGETESGHIYEYVKTQVDYLNNFRLVVQSSDEFNAAWEQRAEQYARGIVAPYWKGRTKILPLPAMPGDLSTDCGQLCACLWDVKTIDEKAGDYDCYWLLNASRIVKTEHCQDCQTRGVIWAPFRIRGGEIIGGADTLPGNFRFRELLETTVKHLPGKHEQKTHGHRFGPKQGKNPGDAERNAKIMKYADNFLNQLKRRGLPDVQIVVDREHFEQHRNAESIDIPAAFNKEDGIIRLNPAAEHWRNPTKITKQAFQDGKWSTDSKYHVLWHEYGHKMHLDNTPGGREIIDQQKFSRKDYSIARNVSSLAMNSPSQFIAETFAGLSQGRNYDDSVMGLYRSLGGYVL